MNNSFYSGPAGKEFAISWIFSTRYGTGNSMETDISMGWKSPISVGQYVVISYGEPNSENYQNYTDIDVAIDGKGYNSTLWQKIYDEEKNTNNGITYKLIMSMAGFTPRVEFVRPIDVLDADEEPDIIFNRDNPDHPLVKLRLPQSQVLSMYPLEILKAGQKPVIIYDDGKRDPETGELIRDEVGDYGGTINRPVIVFKLPNAQTIQQGQTVILNADEMPYFTIDSSDPDNPVITFYLPQQQILQNPITTIIGPSEDPDVQLNYKDGSVNKPRYDFFLPRSVKFFYGDLLGLKQDKIYTLSAEDIGDIFQDIALGDYYVNETTGFIYIVTNKTEDECTFTYVASVQQPLPDVDSFPISPYTDDKKQNAPTVQREFLNDEQTEWLLKFGMPQAPLPDVDVNFIGPAEDGSGDVGVKDKNTMGFTLNIPRGSRWFTDVTLNEDTQLNHHIEDSKLGDLCINPETGMVYIQTGNNVWTIQQGCLKGPKGDALHIVKTYYLTSEDCNDTLGEVSQIIEQRFKADPEFWDDVNGDTIKETPRMPKDDEIIAVTWRQLDEEGNVLTDTSYWYYYNEVDGWQRAQLTGGFFSLIMQEYDDPGSTDRLYSTAYINSLIGGNIDMKDCWRKTFSIDQLIAMMMWGDIQDAETDEWPPTPGFTHNTFSAEEILELLSWNSLGKLYIKDKEGSSSLSWGELDK